MLGNFFMLICPYVYDHGGVAYFALFRNSHSFHTTRPVSCTAQITVDVYRYNERIYIRPTKGEHHRSRTMQMLHIWENDEFVPVGDSKTYTTIMSDLPWDRQEGASHLLGLQTNTFARAKKMQTAIDRGETPNEDVDAFVMLLLLMLIGKRGRMYDLACRYLRACLKRSSSRLSGGTAQSAALLLLEIALLVHRRRAFSLGPSRSEILGRTLLNTL